MIDEATGTMPVFEKLLGTCKRYLSLDANVGISKADKDHCRQQFRPLMKIQLKNSQLTYPEMKDAGLPLDIDSRGNDILEDRPSGPHAEHRQTAKTINGPAQQRMRSEHRRKKLNPTVTPSSCATPLTMCYSATRPSNSSSYQRWPVGTSAMPTRRWATFSN